MGFWSLYRKALDAGLNKEYCSLVAYGMISLDEALGRMDMNAESLPFDPKKDAEQAVKDNLECGNAIPF